MSEQSPVTFQSPDAGSRTAGEIIRDARLAQGLTLEQLAGAIKVSVAKLSALEDGRFDELPDANFARALAMTLCRGLKLDTAQVLAGLPAAKTASLGTDKQPLNQPFKDVRRTSPLFEHGFNWSSLWSLKWLAPAGLLLAAVAVYLAPDSVDVPSWLQWPPASAPVAASAPEPSASAEALLPEPPASDPALNASAAVITYVPVPPASVPSSPTLSLDVSEAAAQAASGPASTQGISSTVAPLVGHDLVLNVSSSSWVDVRDVKGIKLLSRQVEAGEVLTLQGRAPLKLNIGNAPGVRVTYSGLPVDLVPYTRANVARLELK